MKKVLILYGIYGGGHLSVAKSVKEYIDNNFEDTQTEMIDCIEYINSVLNKVTVKTYYELTTKFPKLWGKVYNESKKKYLGKISSTSNKVLAVKLIKLLREKKPDYIISTHPFSSQMCAYLKKKNKTNAVISTILTDYDFHEQWLCHHEFCDYFFVAHNELRKSLINYGINENKIFSTGIPISSKYFEKHNRTEILNNLHLSPKKSTILFFGGRDLRANRIFALEVFKTILSLNLDIQIIAITGRTKNNKKHYKEIVEEYDMIKNVRVLAYSKNIAKFMSVSELVVTKPGGITATESLFSNLPILMINPIPGQEEENAAFIEENGLGVYIKKDSNIKEIFSALFTDNHTLNQLKENCKKISKQNSSKEICDIIFKNS